MIALARLRRRIVIRRPATLADIDAPFVVLLTRRLRRTMLLPPRLKRTAPRWLIEPSSVAGRIVPPLIGNFSPLELFVAGETALDADAGDGEQAGGRAAELQGRRAAGRGGVAGTGRRRRGGGGEHQAGHERGGERCERRAADRELRHLNPPAVVGFIVRASALGRPGGPPRAPAYASRGRHGQRVGPQIPCWAWRRARVTGGSAAAPRSCCRRRTAALRWAGCRPAVRGSRPWRRRSADREGCVEKPSAREDHSTHRSIRARTGTPMTSWRRVTPGTPTSRGRTRRWLIRTV